MTGGSIILGTLRNPEVLPHKQLPIVTLYQEASIKLFFKTTSVDKDVFLEYV